MILFAMSLLLLVLPTFKKVTICNILVINSPTSSFALTLIERMKNVLLTFLVCFVSQLSTQLPFITYFYYEMILISFFWSERCLINYPCKNNAHDFTLFFFYYYLFSFPKSNFFTACQLSTNECCTTRYKS